MKTLKNKIKKLFFSATLAFVGTIAQAQITASVANNILTEVAENNGVISFTRPLAFEAAICPKRNVEKIELRYGKIGGSDLTVTLFDTEAHSIFYRKLDKNEKGFFRQEFDIKGLSEGTYHFVLKSGKEKIVKKFEIRPNTARMIMLD